MGVGQKSGYKEIVQRMPGRYEMRHGLDREPLLNLRRRVEKSSAFETARRILRDELRILGCSVVIAERDCAAQAWHVDGAHLSPDGAPFTACAEYFRSFGGRDARRRHGDKTREPLSYKKPGEADVARAHQEDAAAARRASCHTWRRVVIRLSRPAPRHAEQHGRRAARLRADGREALVPGPRELSQAGAVRRGDDADA